MLHGRRWWWWTVLVEAMTRRRCSRRKKMMGRGANGGCGTEEKRCPISRVPVPVPVTEIGDSTVIEKQKLPLLGVDFYSQARKALAAHCPFDSEDVQGSALYTLPSELASNLAKKSDSRKRHKKSHTGADTKKKSSSRPEKARGRNIWVETEEYFRGLNIDDIDKLYEVSSLRHLAGQKHFVIPSIGNVNAEAANGSNDNDNASAAKDSGMDVKDTVIDAKEEEVMHLMEVDSVGATNLPPKEEEEKGCSLPHPCSGVEWLLGSRTKIYLASERPSKKRKLLGGDAGLEKLFVACPVKEASSSLCHYCSQGDTDDQLNRLIVCSSCGMAVHQRCYGVQNDEPDCWLCSWCRQQKKESRSIDKPCVLCPQQGGALKPVRKRGFGNGNDVSLEFAHLFCCQWMPEVYIEDTRTMEPILNVEGIKDSWRKLICYLCKAKCGACVRCSYGACRTSFHPICAREARHRMEIWGKLGCDDVELRAFCTKHSEVSNSNSIQQLGDLSVPVGSGSSVINHQPNEATVKKPHKLKIGRRNGDKPAIHVGTPETKSGKLGDTASCVAGELDTISDSKGGLQSDENQQSMNKNAKKKNGAEDNMQEARNLTRFLKQLIDQRKVDAKEVASEIGVTADTLASNFADGRMVPGLHCKIVNWLRDHDHMPVLQKNLKVKFKSTILSKSEIGVGNTKDAIPASEPDVTDALFVKSLPPRRRTKSNIKTLKDNKIICSSKRSPGDDGVVMDAVREGHSREENSDIQSSESHPVAEEKVSVESFGVPDSSPRSSPVCEDDPAKPMNNSPSDTGQADVAVIYDWSTMVNSNLGNPACSSAMDQCPSAIACESLSGSYIHPLVRNEVLEMENRAFSGSRTPDDDGLRDGEVCTLEASSSSDICCNQQSQRLTPEFLSNVNPEHLVKAKNMSILDLSPGDEVEGELVYYQHRLLCNAVARRRFSDDLIRKVIKSLPHEIDVLREKNWDAVLVNQYLCELREAKKQGRKERRHKEAQAVLAAATAAAAASSRISSFRKDALDDPSAQEANMLKVNPLGGRGGHYAQQVPRAKETLPRLAVARVTSERNSDSLQSMLEFPKEHSRTCDICRRAETILNPVLVCSSCKVTVHLDCYRSVKESTGPWYCELCEDPSSSRNMGASTLNSGDNPSLLPECCLCGGAAGAFRKSTDGQWVHAFCAEWVLESTFRRGQVNPIEGVETITKGSDLCLICSRKQGVCVKCNYGHCQSTFHPACAKSAGFYMNVRTTGGKLQHKAYCEKHSLVERAKTETQKHGNEEMNSLKKVRVELERLRLICERIIKREKLKRELVLCSQDTLRSNKDFIVSSSSRVVGPFLPPDVSSESDTTSLKGYTDGYKSGSEAVQRSDDVTVDSTVAGKRRIRFPMSMDVDQKTDDSSTSQLFVQKPPLRSSFSGKQIPRRPPSSAAASQSTSDDGEKLSKYRKHTETFKKEVVMTSDQACMRNQRLPKGFVYVPIDRLSNEKEVVVGPSSQENSAEHDG